MNEDINLYKKKLIKVFFLILVCVTVNCKSKDKSIISTRINAILIQDSLAYKALTNGYKFKIYDNGIGKNFTQPIYNDSIIILKDGFTKNIILSKINNGKSILIDSVGICELSYMHDQNGQIMRSFLKISYNPKIDDIKIEIKNWVPQFIEGGYRCVEIPNY